MSKHLQLALSAAILALATAFAHADEAPDLEVRLHSVSGPERLALLAELSELHRDTLPERSLDLAREGVELATGLQDSAAEARLRIATASALNLLGRNVEAVAELHAALEIQRSAGDAAELARTLRRIGAVQLDLGRYPEALERYQESLGYAEATGDDLETATTLASLGNLLTRIGRLEEATDRHRRALALFERHGYELGIAATALALGDLLAQTGRASASVEHYGKALELATASGMREAEASAHLGLARGFEQLGDYRRALTHTRAAAELGDALGSLETARQLAELEARFAAERESREIERERLEKAERALEIERQKTQRNLAAAFGLVVLGLTALLYGRYRRQRRAVAELEGMSRSDPLTGLANRRALLERLSAERSRADRTGRRFAVVLADLDWFKTVNDRYGHSGGDAVLQQVARRLLDTVRAQDVVGRWGGEELMLILPETDPDGAAVLAEKTRTAVASAPFDVDGRPVPVTLTLGVAGYTPHGTLDGTIRAADRAMYAGKRAGRDRVVVAEAEHRPQVIQMPGPDTSRAQRAG